jgi:hypothetical protein
MFPRARGGYFDVLTKRKRYLQGVPHVLIYPDGYKALVGEWLVSARPKAQGLKPIFFCCLRPD